MDGERTKPKHTKGAGKKLHRKLTGPEINLQCREIAQRWSRGQTEYDIRAEMHMSSRTYGNRIHNMRGAGLDAFWIWTRFSESVREDIARLFNIYLLALGPAPKPVKEGEEPEYVKRDLSEALRSLAAIGKLRRECIVVGQSLGIYERTAPPQN